MPRQEEEVAACWAVVPQHLLAGTRAKLANDAFVKKAPANVVDGVRSKEVELAELIERLRASIGD